MRIQARFSIFAMMLVLIGFSAQAFAQNGKALYEKSCASCHNVDGKGKPAMAKMLAGGDATKLDLTKASSKAKTDADLAQITNDGVGKMKAFKSTLKPADVTAVISHVRMLQKSAK